ncbi:methylated-DNA--[protein]-cysteine S-methyltransferase [Candidatus Uabimicrobium amorphum]|uniref:methylated-DNA--[protein]-cysteine S-methyltransferase n=1 Tax=Uabimicrobium amorphum TaxID=2596890 RepID=A0A5S9IRN2_UABAM|nr:methylated-DNA--[protein]-cysteine S-methyltransferase [Candidatus Uabimicrobium amorphum]BBM85435.1 methylated-DNA--protein-cysteinemethyltransferase [Candidatus Uabimicrobium amorphum]
MEKKTDYQVIEKALLFIEDNFRSQPNLGEVAKHVHLSEYHFQRLFRRWAGVTPKRFMQFISKEHAKKLLEESRSILSTAYDTGLSGSSRLHDLFVTYEGVTPGEYKSFGKNVTIYYGVYPTIFGECSVAMTDRGICEMHFAFEEFYTYLCRKWKSANLVEDNKRVACVVQKIFYNKNSTHLLLCGTKFQIKVWEALLQIPQGTVVCYSDIARYLGNEKSVRAVASAIAKNPIAFLVPCHRVIRKMGYFNNYRWGKVRKKAILGWEIAQS